MFDSLRSLSSQQLLTNTDSLVAQDRKLTLRLLEHLHEIDRRKLYLERGFASMFDYCTKHLKLAEPSAARRIRTARCVARYPQLAPLLESGELNLTVVSMVSKYIKPGNVDELIGRIKGRSKRDVERIVAEYEPKAVVPKDRARVMIVPVARSVVAVASAATTEAGPRPSISDAPAPVPMVTPRSASPIAPETPPVSRSTAIATPVNPGVGSKFTVTGDSEKSPKLEVVSDSTETARPIRIVDAVETEETESQSVQYERLVRVEFTANENLMTKLERIRSLASHRLPANATLEELIDFMAEYVITREDPIKRQERRESREVKQEENKAQAVSANPRHIPAKVRDQVFVRDNQCTYVSPEGQRCGSRHVLQIDHIKPVARGGASTIDNLRVLCAYHNRMESERLMGKRRLRTE